MAAASSGRGCDSPTGALEGRRRSFYGGIYLRQDGAAALKAERARSAPGRARKAAQADPSPPRFPPPLSPPAGTRPTLAGLFREGVKAVGLSMGGRHLFRSSRGGGLAVLKIGVREAPKRNLKGILALPEHRRCAPDCRPPPAVRLRPSRQSGTCSDPAPRECLLPTLRHPRICFLPDLDISSIS